MLQPCPEEFRKRKGDGLEGDSAEVLPPHVEDLRPAGLPVPPDPKSLFKYSYWRGTPSTQSEDPARKQLQVAGLRLPPKPHKSRSKIKKSKQKRRLPVAAAANTTGASSWPC